jgi:hypothetical protein
MYIIQKSGMQNAPIPPMPFGDRRTKIMKRQEFVLQMTHDVMLKELGNLPFEDVIEQVLDTTDKLETEYRRRYQERLFNN